ncbi:MAG: VOC family protein [Pseudomonadales bacterium]|nr:VOC family protein [Pseudomonadales bacterium]
MTEENPSILNHVSVAVSNSERSLAFYDAIFATIGAARMMEHENAIAYGKQFPEFWVHTEPYDGGKPETAKGIHFSFSATSKEQVGAFFDAALAHGGTGDGAAGPRPEYGEPYYGCFVRDPDGHKLEATFWDESLM